MLTIQSFRKRGSRVRNSKFGEFHVIILIFFSKSVPSDYISSVPQVIADSPDIVVTGKANETHPQFFAAAGCGVGGLWPPFSKVASRGAFPCPTPSAVATAGCPMPSSTRPAAPGPTNVSQSSKRVMSDAEAAPQDLKKARRNSSAEPTTRRDSGRDTKRRRKRKKKAPVVSTRTAKNEATQSRLDERSRAPLSARNEIIRFTSAPPEADLPASVVPAAKPSSQAPSPKLFGKSRETSLHFLDDITVHRSEAMPSTPRDKSRVIPADTPLPGPSAGSLEDKVAQLEAELKSKDNLITSHQALLNQVQQAVTCQVCLDLMYKPYALAPCGHLACHSCLVNWFTTPPPDNRHAPPAIMRRKTCPHCRAVVHKRPVEVWGVKGIAQAMGKSGLLPNQLPVPVEAPESLDANGDPWNDIFPKPGAATHRGFPWFFPGADIDDDDIHIADIAPRGDDVGMLDMEDGGIYRCLDCMHEIWGGVCTSCGRVYPGHRPEGDDGDDDGDPMGWLEDQMGAEEVDVADDPGWMGLEDGEADDGGDIDDWRPFAPWRRHFHMFRGPWGFSGTIHVDGEDEEEDEDDVRGRVDDLRFPNEDDESDDEGYESSFIDDDDQGGVIDTIVDRPHIYEIGDDREDEDYPPNWRGRIVDLVSDDHEEDAHEGSDVVERGWSGHRHVVVVSSDEEDEVVHSRSRSLSL
ncbi:hypothetical protein J3R82DRAFT_8054 [Butyriboletus roseoflavus]|nr:hypothetical protein J3R82DRAFT_8054 [Butyriboletus roseoflavus]